jgi:N-acyl-D-amino-acid deacylase
MATGISCSTERADGLLERAFATIIEGGTVIDGLGGSPRRADIAVVDGRVAAIGELRGTTRELTLDAAGQVVAPGFIDIHSHSDISLLVDPRGESGLLQGVTTEVVGNCGHGPAPIADGPDFRSNLYGALPSLRLDWVDLAGYLARLTSAGPGPNVGVLVPNGNLRLAAMGPHPRRASPEDRRRMIGLLEQAMSAGALGLSSGLEYPLEADTSVSDIVALCRVVASAGGLYATHTRDRGVRVVEATQEAIANALRTGVRTQVAHALPRRESPAGTVERVIDLLEGAALDLDLGWDMHTRTFAGAGLGSVLPMRAPGEDEAAYASVIRSAIDSGRGLLGSFARAGWETVSVAGDPELAGRTLADVSGETGRGVAEILARAWLVAERKHLELMIHAQMYDEAGITRIATSSRGMLASDAASQSRGGPYPKVILYGAFSWAAWMLRRLVRETHALALPEAIRRLTSVPASRAGLGQRGRLIVGAAADLVVFDPSAIADIATPDDPLQPSIGVRHVLVNGQAAVRDGRLTGVRAGHVLGRGGASA